MMSSDVPTPSYAVEAETYSQRVYRISRDVTVFHRDQVIRQEAQTIDAFGASWMFGVGHLETGRVGYGRSGEVHLLTGDKGFFLPPYSLVQWHLKPGRIQWSAIHSERALPAGLPKQAISFPWPKRRVPDTLPEVYEFLAGLKPGDYEVIEKLEKPSALASRAKALIDRDFKTDLKITELAHRLRVSRVVLTRAFHEAYGLAPVAYRNRLRIFFAAGLLRSGESVTDAALNSGFSDMSRFNRQFKRQLATQPSRFSPRRRGGAHDDIPL